MHRPRLIELFTLLAGLSLMTAPAWGVSKEIVQLQTQVQALQDQMRQMQQSFDERMGIMRNLVEQSTDNVNKVAASISTLQTNLQKQQADSSGHIETLSGQIQALNDSIDELKVRLTKLSKQLEDMQSQQQSITAQAAQIQQQQQAPPPDVLYNNGLRDYNAGKTDLALQEFNDYLKFYPNTDLAGNAYFYLAEIAYKQGNYAQAVTQYNKVLENFPSGNKAAAAHLKKGFALAEMGKNDDAAAELKALIQRFPRSPEATQARDRLRRLGAPPSPTAQRSR
jgi:tol-pal system protein YbgF